MIRLPKKSAIELEEEEPVVVKRVPTFGSVEWIYYWSDVEGYLPSPIPVSITGSTFYKCPELKWYNFDVYPHKIRLTNTGYTILLAGKWKTERPYLEGGPLLERHVLGQVHFHWGPTLFSGSDHLVDNNKHPAELQVTFFKSEYMTQDEALRHEDGVVMFCYIIKYGVEADKRLTWVIKELHRVKECGDTIKIGPKPFSQLLPMFYEDYFLYWGDVKNGKGDQYAIRWLIPRINLCATAEQLNEFRKLWDVWDEPNLGNARPLQDPMDRHVFLINPHWNLYNSLLPTPRIPEESISVLSAEYKAKPWMLPPLNASFIKLLTSSSEVDNTEKKVEDEGK